MKKIEFYLTQLPEKWIDENVRNNFKNDVALNEGWLNNQLKEAIEKEELTFNLSLIKKLIKSETAIYDLMYSNYNEYIKANSFIPKTEKERVKQSYINVADRLKDICSIAYSYLQKYKFTLKQEKDGFIRYVPDEVEEYINTIGIRTFTDKEREYYTLLNNATKALVEVTNFERENGIREYALLGFGLMPKHDDPLNAIAYPCGLVHDARLGTVNFERIIQGVMKQ